MSDPRFFRKYLDILAEAPVNTAPTPAATKAYGATNGATNPAKIVPVAGTPQPVAPSNVKTTAAQPVTTAAPATTAVPDNPAMPQGMKPAQPSSNISQPTTTAPNVTPVANTRLVPPVK